MRDRQGRGDRSVGAIVLAAGRGIRLGHPLPKAFVPLAGRSLLERSLRRLAASQCIGTLLPVLDHTDRNRFAALGLGDLEGLAAPVDGGAERQDSVAAGLAALPAEIEWVVIHDAARCVVAPEDVARVIDAARETGAAILASPARDTVKRVRNGLVVETPDRSSCFAAQTPQVARRDWIEAAMGAAQKAGRLATDDAQVLEWAGYPVRVVEVRSPNPKITGPEDLVAAEAWLEAMGDPIGTGEAA